MNRTQSHEQCMYSSLLKLVRRLNCVKWEDEKGVCANLFFPLLIVSCWALKNCVCCPASAPAIPLANLPSNLHTEYHADFSAGCLKTNYVEIPKWKIIMCGIIRETLARLFPLVQSSLVKFHISSCHQRYEFAAARRSPGSSRSPPAVHYHKYYLLTQSPRT